MQDRWHFCGKVRAEYYPRVMVLVHRILYTSHSTDSISMVSTVIQRSEPDDISTQEVDTRRKL